MQPEAKRTDWLVPFQRVTLAGVLIRLSIAAWWCSIDVEVITIVLAFEVFTVLAC